MLKIRYLFFVYFLFLQCQTINSQGLSEMSKVVLDHLGFP